MALKFGGILPFEFLKYLSATYVADYDLIFYIDVHQCWYHRGINGITNNIDETILYLNDTISKYEKVIFMGTSAGGYASILFGSMCNNVNNVIGFIPQTLLEKPLDLKYSNLKNTINKHTKYLLYGDMSQDGDHHISHCENIECFTNVSVIKNSMCNLKELRDNGSIKRIIDDIMEA